MKRIVLVLLVIGVAWWLTHGKKSTPAGSDAASPAGAASNALACVNAADAANGKLHDAAMLVGHPPVDAGAWSSAQGDVSSAISSAESACGSPNTDADRKAADEVKAALELMRSTLSVLDAQAHGQGTGGSAAVQNQEQIDAHLDRARGLAKG